MNAAILLSRQKLYPHKKIPWVIKVLEALNWIKNQELAILTSTGTPTWELLITGAKRKFIKQIICISADSINNYKEKENYFRRQFIFDNNMRSIPIISTYKDKKDNYVYRDEKIIELADILIPVSIRKSGFINKKLTESVDKNINYSFYTPYKYSEINTNKNFNNYSIRNVDIFYKDNYYIHWTRKNRNGWPDETLDNYYSAILKSDTYPRDAFQTIMRILEKKKIIGSERHLSSGSKCVSFTGSSVVDFVKLMKWRKRYTEYSFEPYGLGIEKKFGISIGIHKITYLHKYALKEIDPSERWKYHSLGEYYDWITENEYRYKGDLDFFNIPNDKLICFCLHKEEASIITKKYSILTYYISEN